MHPLRAAIQPSAAAAAPKCVATNALVARPDAASALPALNPNQPTHSRHAPMKLSTRLCGFIGSLGIAHALAQIQRAHQRRDARRDVHHRAAREVEARESCRPETRSAVRPCPTPCAPSGSRRSEHHSTMNSSMALNFMRSANAPEISAGVMIANINW